VRGVDAHLEMGVKRNPNRGLATKVRVQLEIEGDLTDAQRQELMHEADNCYVHRMIMGDWAIENAVPFAETTVEA